MSKHAQYARACKTRQLSTRVDPLQDNPHQPGQASQRIRKVQKLAQNDWPCHPLPCISSTLVNWGSWGVACISGSLGVIILCATPTSSYWQEQCEIFIKHRTISAYNLRPSAFSPPSPARPTPAYSPPEMSHDCLKDRELGTLSILCLSRYKHFVWTNHHNILSSLHLLQMWIASVCVCIGSGIY